MGNELKSSGGSDGKVLAAIALLCLSTSEWQNVYERVRDFLARRHKMAGRGAHRFSRAQSSMESRYSQVLDAIGR
jgi:hypothetical protein